MKKILVGGAGGFIGSHLVKKLKSDGFWVRGVMTVQSTAVSGPAVIQTAIEQFDLQDDQATMWGYDEGWQARPEMAAVA